MNTLIKTWIPVIAFQIQWWLCILSGIENHGQYDYLVAVVIFFINLFFQPLTRPMFLLFLILLSVGTINDTLLMKMGIFQFSNHLGYLIPIWLIVLWACLSYWFLNAQWLNQRLILVLFLFSIGGVGSYYYAVKLHALTFLVPMHTSLIILALDWFCLGLIFFLTVRCLRLRGTHL